MTTDLAFPLPWTRQHNNMDTPANLMFHKFTTLWCHMIMEIKSLIGSRFSANIT